MSPGYKPRPSRTISASHPRTSPIKGSHSLNSPRFASFRSSLSPWYCNNTPFVSTWSRELSLFWPWLLRPSLASLNVAKERAGGVMRINILRLPMRSPLPSRPLRPLRPLLRRLLPGRSRPAPTTIITNQLRRLLLPPAALFRVPR